MIGHSLNSALSMDHIIVQHQSHGVAYIIVSTSKLGELKLNEENPLAPGHPSCEWWSWDLDQVCQTQPEGTS